VPVLTRDIPGTLLGLWDGAAIHGGQAVKDLLATGEATRMHLERVPGSAPAWNPHEGVWNLLTRVERKHVWCLEVQHIQMHVRRAKERLRHRPFVLRQCFAHAGCFLSGFLFRSIRTSPQREQGAEESSQMGSGSRTQREAAEQHIWARAKNPESAEVWPEQG
jgi:hypothetical protein